MIKDVYIYSQSDGVMKSVLVSADLAGKYLRNMSGFRSFRSFLHKAPKGATFSAMDDVTHFTQ